MRHSRLAWLNRFGFVLVLSLMLSGLAAAQVTIEYMT